MEQVLNDAVDELQGLLGGNRFCHRRAELLYRRRAQLEQARDTFQVGPEHEGGIIEPVDQRSGQRPKRGESSFRSSSAFRGARCALVPQDDNRAGHGARLVEDGRGGVEDGAHHAVARVDRPVGLARVAMRQGARDRVGDLPRCVLVHEVGHVLDPNPAREIRAPSRELFCRPIHEEDPPARVGRDDAVRD